MRSGRLGIVRRTQLCDGLVQRQLHLLTVVEVEWSEARGRVLRVVDGELSGCEMLVPVGLLRS